MRIRHLGCGARACPSEWESGGSPVPRRPATTRFSHRLRRLDRLHEPSKRAHDPTFKVGNGSPKRGRVLAFEGFKKKPSFYLLEITRLPGLVEPRLERRIETKDRVPAFSGHR